MMRKTRDNINKYISDSVLGTSYASSCNVVGEFPMMTATTESVFLNLLVKNEPEDLTGHRERQGDFLFSRDTYAVLLAVWSLEP